MSKDTSGKEDPEMNNKRITTIIALLVASVLVFTSFAAVFAEESSAYPVEGQQNENMAADNEVPDADQEQAAVDADAPEFEDSAEAMMEGTVSGDGETQTEPEVVVCEHEWSEWTTVKAATFFEAGSRERICNLCGETERETIAKKIARNRWAKNGNKRYYFNNKGRKIKGWHKIKASNKKNAKIAWCYFDGKGVFRKKVSKDVKNKWVKIGKKTFYFTNRSKLAPRGFRMINSKLYYFNKSRTLRKSRFKYKGVKYRPNRKNGQITGDQFYIYKYRTFVLVDISSQRMRFYKNGRLKLRADVITGKRGVHDTPTGTFSIRYKKRNITLSGGAYVHYWMAFIGTSHGMHDAVTWRSSSEFSNHRTYIYNGSHGCINMRYGDAAKLYRTAPTGTPVIVQH